MCVCVCVCVCVFCGLDDSTSSQTWTELTSQDLRRWNWLVTLFIRVRCAAGPSRRCSAGRRFSETHLSISRFVGGAVTAIMTENRERGGRSVASPRDQCHFVILHQSLVGERRSKPTRDDPEVYSRASMLRYSYSINRIMVL